LSGQEEKLNEIILGIKELEKRMKKNRNEHWSITWNIEENRNFNKIN